jgi:hypothetical protein
MFSSPRIGRDLLLAIAAIAVAGLAPVAAADTGAEAELRERVTQYWTARVARSQDVYRFYPGPELGGPLDSTLIGEFGTLAFEGFEIQGLEIQDEKATVSLQVDVVVERPGAGGTRRYASKSAEVWNRICGTWYRQPLRRSLVRKDFLPSELGPVPEGGPDCSKGASAPVPGGAENSQGAD